MGQDPILLVEDNPNDVVLIRRALKKIKVVNKIVVARDGAEALDCLFGTGTYEGRDAVRPTVVILDIKLPKIDGFEVLQRIRADKRTRRLPVVILTSSDEQGDVIRGYDLGCTSYVRKTCIETFTIQLRICLFRSIPKPQS